MVNKRLLILSAAVLCTVGLLSVCTNDVQEEKPSPPPPLPLPIGPDLSYLLIEGNKVLNENGEEVLLQGINAGGYLVTERWMCAIASGGVVDHKPTTDLFTEKFGKAKTLQIWDHYRKTFWTEDDFRNCEDMGMNVIRLPFSYMSVDPVYNHVPEIPGEKYNFTILDNFIERAKTHKMYTILDMHGAYGSQNGQDHSGQSIAVPSGGNNQQYVTFYSATDPDAIENRRKTTELWEAIAERYKDNPNVAGYDLLNEPGEKGTSTQRRHWDYFDELYKAIRAVDPDHIIIIESCWAGSDLPHPVNSTYNWENNVMYSFHHYTHSDGVSSMPEAQRLQGHKDSMLRRVNEVAGRNFGIPIYMGEFTCLYGEEGWTYMLDLLQERGWHWTTWTYKVNQTSATATSPWGIYNSRLRRVVEDDVVVTDELVVTGTDSFETIIQKWSRIGTKDRSITPYTFPSGKTLYDLMKEYCTRDLTATN